MERNYLIYILLIFAYCDHIVYANELIPAAPEINASSYLLMDFNSGRILATENIDQRLAPASLTKMMTVYVVASELAAGKLSLDEMVTISEKAWKMPGSRMFVEVGKKVSAGDLIMGVIIQSGNDASVALAEHISGSDDVFAQIMNQHAKRLGLKNTHYVNSTGLPDEQHYTTANDLALLAIALIRDFPDIYALHAIKEFTFNDIKQQNRNKLLWKDKSVDGIKTGHTEEAGFCLVSSAKRDDMRLISVVLGTTSTNSREQASQALLNYGFRFYETKKIYSKNEIAITARIWKGEEENVDLGVPEDLYVTIPRGKIGNIEKTFDLPEKIIAPVSSGDTLGRLILILSGNEILVSPMVVLRDIRQANFFSRIKDEFHLIFE